LAYKDPVGPLKAFVNFVKETEKGEIKAGIIEKTFVKKDQIVAISKLPGKDILLGKLAASFKSPLYGLVNVLNGPARKLVYALKAIAEKKGGEQK
jgi:large subunit ribosomal protein L10